MRWMTVLTLLLVLVAARCHASSTDEEVAEIRALYNGVGTSEDDSCFGKPCLQAETTFMRMMPGTGPQQTHVRFYYAEHLADDEQIYATAYLQKVVVTHNIAAQEYYTEYLFSGLQAQLVFHFQVDHLTERRTWLGAGHPIRMDIRPKGKPEDKTVRDTGFTAAELAHVQLTQARAADLIALFATVVKTADGAMGSWPLEED